MDKTCRWLKNQELLLLIINVGYPGLEKEETGCPGYPPSTQWNRSDIHASKLHNGRHLLYKEAAGKGMSGSPLFFIDKKREVAFAIGLHVGRIEHLANAAIPISFHRKTKKTWVDDSSTGRMDISS